MCSDSITRNELNCYLYTKNSIIKTETPKRVLESICVLQWMIWICKGAMHVGSEKRTAATFMVAFCCWPSQSAVPEREREDVRMKARRYGQHPMAANLGNGACGWHACTAGSSRYYQRQYTHMHIWRELKDFFWVWAGGREKTVL
jgi:hypothetical protein